MKEIVENLKEIQLRMEKIEARLISFDTDDPSKFDEAERLLERYLHQVSQLENFILHRRMAILEEKIARQTPVQPAQPEAPQANEEPPQSEPEDQEAPPS